MSKPDKKPYLLNLSTKNMTKLKRLCVKRSKELGVKLSVSGTVDLLIADLLNGARHE